VQARTWYEGYGEARRRQEETMLTGEKDIRFAIKTPWRAVTVDGQGMFL